MKIIFINEKLEAFEILQKALIIKTYLYYYNSNRQIYINLNKLKKYDFKVIIYYVKEDS